MATGQQASAKGMAVEGAEDEGEADLAATTSMEAAGVADTAMTTRTTDTVADVQEGRGAGGRGRGRGGRGGRGGGAASMKSAGNESESRDDRFPGQFFFVSTQASAGPEKDEGFEEPAAVGKVTLHSLDYWVIDSGTTYSMTPRADLLTELEPSPVKHVTSALGQRAEVKGMGKAMFKGPDEKMVGLKNVLWVPHLAANLISVRRLQKAGMDTSSKGAKTYTARLGERILWDLHKDRDVCNKMWQISVVPMPKERQVAASISTKDEAVGSGDGANGRAQEMKSKKCNLGGTSKLDEHEESGAAAKKQHKDEENPKALRRSTERTCGALLRQLVKNKMVAGIRVKGEPDEVLGCPTCMQAKFTRYPFSSSEATAKAPLDEVVMDDVGPLKLGVAGTEYFLTIVDVYTRMTWVYVLSKKSDVAETVKTDWLPMVERQQDRSSPRNRQRRLDLLPIAHLNRTTLLAGAAFKGWVVKQMDVTTAFLNGVLEEEIFMVQPEGFDDGSGRVLKLKKALYGLKQAPRQWYLKLRGVLVEIGFTPSTTDHSLFMLGEGEQRSFMEVYVDDILIFLPSSDLVKEVMLKLQNKFKCKALGDVNFYLGLHVERDVEKRCMRVHQHKYLEALGANFGQSEGHVATPFPSRFKCVKGSEEESVGEEERRRFHSVGSLMYAAINTRSDVAFATGQLARVVKCPKKERVAWPKDMTSVGGFICCVGGGPTAWESKKHVDQALSSVESEYMALFRAVREIVWQRRLLAELGEKQQGPNPLYYDSQGAIAIAKNPVLHGLTKHMRVKWHWTRSMVAAGEVELRYVKTTGQPANMMTKRLVEQQHWKCCKLAGMALN
ncbi:unnamed protein product [Closterium sp. NIES-53]